VVLSDTDHLWGIGGDATWVWMTVARGLNPLFMDTYDGRVLGSIRPQDEAARRAMGHALEYSHRMNLARATPRNALSSTAYCLAEPGATYLVFAPEGGDIELDLTEGPGSYCVEWLTPSSNEATKTGRISGGAKQLLRAPFEGPATLFVWKELFP